MFHLNQESSWLDELQQLKGILLDTFSLEEKQRLKSRSRYSLATA